MSNEIFIVSLLFLGISFIVSAILKSKFTKYSKIPLSNGLSGREIAEKMLQENGIYDVKVTSVNGFLSDHYNPKDKTVNLSPDVYNGRSISAAAVAAHECGHAVQHATSYGPLVMRSKMVPAVQFSSMLVNWILLAGMIVLATTKSPTVLLIGIIIMSVTVLFTLITLPVEFDASKRALAWLERTNITSPQEYPKAKDALKWAATTYVVAALAAVVTLIQYVMIYLGSRDRN
ncbi:MAG: zinc metallopeptidase [Chitinophagaceae bacterium]|nr:zinc metallopeptidase [Chitinophagaceae bacterium]MBK8309789.1 zinc metallopeptidase [Chitinophagaceae bacterium]MBK8606611.1 zinc metallopeptidase [Chitinophagaceae bacterium]MBP6476089.1 zinc metallopeptidase [Chitinophagaceae bacterium]MBP7107278.1 zinc metallopeptidase [Chitinophagaceae bacterium]